MNLDDLYALERGTEMVSGAIADIILFDTGRVAWRIWPDDPDSAYIIARLTAHGHVFVVSDQPTDAAALYEMVRARYGR